MEYIKLNNGISMPVLGLGTWALHGKECEGCVSKALEYGYRLIDTAQMYGNEKEVGNAVKKSGIPRKEVFITTKLCTPCTSYSAAKSGIERSFENLGVDYIDLLLIHEPYSTSLEIYEAMTEGVKEGKIKSIGVSNFNKNFYLDFIKKCEIIPAVNQVECHVFYRQKDLHNTLEENGTHMQAWSPFACGKNNFFNNSVLNTLGIKYGKSAAQIGLRYLVQAGISVIPKSSHPDRIKTNADIFDFELNEDDLSRIQKLDLNKTLFGWY